MIIESGRSQHLFSSNNIFGSLRFSIIASGITIENLSEPKIISRDSLVLLGEIRSVVVIKLTILIFSRLMEESRNEVCAISRVLIFIFEIEKREVLVFI